MRFVKTSLAVAVSLALTACNGGGGGGGGGGGALNTGWNGYNSHLTRVGSVKPLSGSGAVATETALVAQDIDGTGGDELILVGRQNPRGATAGTWQDFDISIWGWQGGTLVDKTSQWFGSGVSRGVTGVEEEVKFGDFDGDGHKDMYAGPYTDTPSLRAGIELSSSSGAVFFNSGSSGFDQRVNITLDATTQAHASAIADLNGDGIDDIWSTANGSSMVLLGNALRNISSLSVTCRSSAAPFNCNQSGGAGVAIADFTAVGTKGVILTDQATAKAAGQGTNNLYRYDTINPGDTSVSLSHVSSLPKPRFEYQGTGERWAASGFTGGHDVRVLADIQLCSGTTASSSSLSRPTDLNGCATGGTGWAHTPEVRDGNGNIVTPARWDRTSAVVSDAVVISRANQYGAGHAQENQWPELSEIQFLKNNGLGTFTDITGVRNDGTDGVLKDYNFMTSASYNASFRDVNGDGHLDIILPSNSWSDNSGAQILMWQSATNAYGFVYQASYATVLKAFQDGAKSLESNSSFTANGVALIQDPSGALYVATAVGTDPNNTGHATHRAIYITALNSMTPQATITHLRNNWPWLTDAQIQTILRQSTTTYFNLNLLDPTLALSPIGGLTMPTANGSRPITGAVTGLRLGDSAAALKVQDGLGRAFEMDYSSTQSSQLNVWSSRLEHNDDSTRTLSIANNLRFGESDGFRYGASDDNRTRVFGMPNYRLTDQLTGTWQFTNLDYSPWMTLSGSWGKIQSTNTVEGTLSYQSQGWTLRGGAMRTTTQLEPGLVTRVNPITAVWADVGYQHQGWSASVGTLPRIVSGSAELTLPTGIDNQGRVQYTNTTVGFDNPLVGFARLGYQGSVAKNTSLRANAMASTNHAAAVKVEVKTTW